MDLDGNKISGTESTPNILKINITNPYSSYHETKIGEIIPIVKDSSNLSVNYEFKKTIYLLDNPLVTWFGPLKGDYIKDGEDQTIQSGWSREKIKDVNIKLYCTDELPSNELILEAIDHSIHPLGPYSATIYRNINVYDEAGPLIGHKELTDSIGNVYNAEHPDILELDSTDDDSVVYINNLTIPFIYDSIEDLYDYLAPDARKIKYTVKYKRRYYDSSYNLVETEEIDSSGGSGFLDTKLLESTETAKLDGEDVYIGFRLGTNTIIWEAWDSGLYSKDGEGNKSETVAKTIVNVVDKSIPIVYFSDLTKIEDEFVVETGIDGSDNGFFDFNHQITVPKVQDNITNIPLEYEILFGSDRDSAVTNSNHKFEGIIGQNEGPVTLNLQQIHIEQALNDYLYDNSNDIVDISGNVTKMWMKWSAFDGTNTGVGYTRIIVNSGHTPVISEMSWNSQSYIELDATGDYNFINIDEHITTPNITSNYTNIILKLSFTIIVGGDTDSSGNVGMDGDIYNYSDDDLEQNLYYNWEPGDIKLRDVVTDNVYSFNSNSRKKMWIKWKTDDYTNIGYNYSRIIVNDPGRPLWQGDITEQVQKNIELNTITVDWDESTSLYAPIGGEAAADGASGDTIYLARGKIYLFDYTGAALNGGGDFKLTTNNHFQDGTSYGDYVPYEDNILYDYSELYKGVRIIRITDKTPITLYYYNSEAENQYVTLGTINIVGDSFVKNGTFDGNIVGTERPWGKIDVTELEDWEEDGISAILYPDGLSDWGNPYLLPQYNIKKYFIGLQGYSSHIKQVINIPVIGTYTLSFLGGSRYIDLSLIHI